MKSNRKTQIALFPARYARENATVTDHKVHPSTDTSATNDNLQIAPQQEKAKHQAMFTDKAQAIVRSQRGPFSVRTTDVEWGSPWKDYQEQFKLHDLWDSLIVAVGQGKLVHIKEMAPLESKDALSKFRILRHKNIIEFIHAYMTDSCLYAVFEPTAFSLLHLALCPRYPDESQLGAIVGQVADGLSYLESQGFEHPSLDNSKIVVTDRGLVKIGKYIFSIRRNRSRMPIRLLIWRLT
ncbi:serine/threonine protein kinase [Colletotrichum truncatum]|uniref:Serine/threonine protein kinase n=1 Tax=Colletotrichum truncatum TaxID=5467 RepID=A0ACC3YEP2_COLTU|nr:serine/threonine protein kinase [Colletotrichum truncatum]KAF6783295.1 serine/threonine protein kinase [Colletotrichum truncatum]